MSENSSNKKFIFAGFLQFDVQSGAVEQNLAQVEAGLAQIAAANRSSTDGIIVLPELWATGFAYEKLPMLVVKIPAVLERLRKLAVKYEIFIAGSLPEFLHNSYFNTLYLTGPEGHVILYRKRRLFSPMGEDTFFTPGTGAGPAQTVFGPVAGLVCYDLRFPELLREQTALGADILIISAQWPAARISHWRTLLQARAIENQMFVVAANRCGATEGTVFGGHSMIVGPDGTILVEAGADEEFSGKLVDPGLLSTARALFCTVPKE